tara:strand:- start:125 stop:544 length:420 start_codon:yes stop_codon:yes gene_type:complete
MRIKITQQNEAKINAEFANLNGKAQSHTASASEVFEMATAMENKLSGLQIAKKDRAGSKASGMSGGAVPSAYKWQRAVNVFNIERGSDAWFLVRIIKTEIYGSARSDLLSLTPVQRDIAIAKFTAQFSVQTVVELAVAA